MCENKFVKTVNGGTNWISYNLSGGWNASAFFTDLNNGWAVGIDGHIIKTTNGGINWTAQSSGTTATLYSIFFLNSNTGWIGGRNNSSTSVLKTTNGGINWLISNNGLSGDVNSIFFVNENIGYAVSDYGIIYKTTNGSTNWFPQTAMSNDDLLSVFFVNSNTGWVCGPCGRIKKTTDGGLHWRNQFSGAFGYLNSLCMVNAQTGWIVGDGGIVLKTTDGGGPTGISEKKYNYVSDFALSQNFPNPFNPSTIIRFKIKDSRFTTLKVFNIPGKEIVTLVNEKLQPGIYEVKFDGSNLPSGIYFYKLESGNFREVKKMVLIK